MCVLASTVKLVYNDTTGATKMCCHNQVVVVTRTFSIELEASETVNSQHVCCCKEVDVVNSDFLTKFDCILNQRKSVRKMQEHVAMQLVHCNWH